MGRRKCPGSLTKNAALTPREEPLKKHSVTKSDTLRRTGRRPTIRSV
jgi:hypothetical protein